MARRARFSRRNVRKAIRRPVFGNFPAERSNPENLWKRPSPANSLRNCPYPSATRRLWRTVEHDYDFRSVRLHFFHITEFSGEPVANDGQAFRWVTPEEALTLPFLEADRPLLFDLSRP